MTDGAGEFTELARVFESATPKMLRNAEKAVKVTSMRVKKDWQERASRSGLGAYARAVDFTITTGVAFGGASVESEIGPSLRKRQGMFGLVEEGGGGVKSAPQFAGRDAVEANEDDFESGLLKAGLEPLEG